MPKLRVATVSFLVDESAHTVEGNLARARKYIDEAKQAGAKIVCLPETSTTNKVSGFDPKDIPESEWSVFFSNAARVAGLIVIAPFFKREANRVFNQASVFDASGALAGLYRKAQPTGREAKFVTPGTDFPVIDLGFVKIGIMICMDIYFPEIARIYAMKGVDLLFWPTITHGPTQSGLEAQLRSRAIDNSLYIIEANLSQAPPYAPYKGRFYPGNARVVDYNGDIIAQTGRRDGLAIADIELDEKRKTLDCFLIEDEDKTREDLESLVRLDLYAKEYASLAKRQKRYYDTIRSSQA